MSDRDELFVDLMAGGVDPVTSYVVAESETARDDKPAAPDMTQAIGIAYCVAIGSVLAALAWWLSG